MLYTRLATRPTLQPSDKGIAQLAVPAWKIFRAELRLESLQVKDLEHYVKILFSDQPIWTDIFSLHLTRSKACILGCWLYHIYLEGMLNGNQS